MEVEKGDGQGERRGSSLSADALSSAERYNTEAKPSRASAGQKVNVSIAVVSRARRRAALVLGPAVVCLPLFNQQKAGLHVNVLTKTLPLSKLWL